VQILLVEGAIPRKVDGEHASVRVLLLHAHKRKHRRHTGTERDESHALRFPESFPSISEPMCHSCICPRSPRNRERRQILRASSVRECLLERVGRSVVGELLRTEQAVDGGEEHKVVERELVDGCVLVKKKATFNLRG